MPGPFCFDLPRSIPNAVSSFGTQSPSDRRLPGWRDHHATCQRNLCGAHRPDMESHAPGRGSHGPRACRSNGSCDLTTHIRGFGLAAVNISTPTANTITARLRSWTQPEPDRLD